MRNLLLFLALIAIGMNANAQDESINGDLTIGIVGKSGNLKIKRGTDGNVAGIIGYNGGGTEAHNLAIQSTSGGGYITFVTNYGVGEKVRIANNGNVGIGITEPLYKLDVNGSLGVLSGADKFYFYPGYSFDARYAGIRTNNGSVAMNAKEGGTLFFNRDVTGNFRIQSNAVDIATFFSDGKVGIGTGAPQTILHVEGNVNGWMQSIKGTVVSPGDFIGLKINTGYAGDYNKWVGLAAVSESVHSSMTGLALYAGQTERMRISNSGNVGIGEVNPSKKLVVNGVIGATEVRVSTTPNSDYVFESDYNLKSLQEVECFIQQNKHLPDIPSAQEFKENGVGLGEMDDMLLRKVEELTLYVIELKKDNKKLIEENQSLRTDLLKEIESIKSQLK